MKQKGFALIIILVLFVIGVVGYFGYKQFQFSNKALNQQTTLPTIAPTITPASLATVNPIANWMYGYLFFPDPEDNIPEKFSMKVPSNSNFYRGFNNWNSTTVDAARLYKFNQTGVINKSGQTIEEYVNNFKDWWVNEDKDILDLNTKTKVTINNTYGFKVTNKNLTYYFLTNQKTDQIIVLRFKNINKDSEATFNQILSTFKFIE